jgi:diguanylate cyclase (GGDEF)-like protein
MARSFYKGLFALAICLLGMRHVFGMDPRLPFHDFVLDHWGVEQGLPQITVLGMAEDRAGFLWVETQSALARFDGARFETFDRRGTGLDTSMLVASWADPDGQMWFGGVHGLLREREGAFTAMGGRAVTAIIDAGDGTPLLATATGLERIRGGQIESLPGYKGAAFSLLRDGGMLWIGGLGQICRVAAANPAAAPTCMRAEDGDRPVAMNRLAIAQGKLWIATQHGLMRLEGEHLVPAGLSPALDSSSIEGLLADRDGTLWIGTVDALYRRLPDGSMETVQDDDIVHHPWVQALYEDHTGNLWLGTHIEGLYRIWNGWTRRVSSRDGVSDTLVWSVTRSAQDELVLGTNSDVEVFDGHHTRLLIPGSALSNPSAYELAWDHLGRLWVGTRAGINVFAHGRKVTPAALEALDRWQINDIREVADDDVWIGTSGGLYRFRQAALARVDPGATAAASSIRSILPLGPDHLYVGTEDGVREWHDGKFDEPAWAAPLRGHFVTRLAMLAPGRLGIATSDAGIGVMVAGQLRMTSQSDGLPSDNAWTLDVLHGDLYVGSIAGAWRLPLEQLPLPGSPQRKVTPQVIAGEERSTSLHNSHCCNGGAGARSLVVGDVIWYSTTDGALALDTRKLGPPPNPPAAVIESVEHDGQLNTGSSYTLSGQSRDLAIHYTAPYLRTGTLQFRYQLEGYDTDWQDAGARRVTFYTHLPPGNYRFRVAATLSGAAGFGAEADLPIEIRPDWYERNWVRAAGALLLAVLIALLVSWRLRAQRRRNAWLEAQVERRTEQLARAVERLRVTNLALAEQSHTDALTALHNRRYLLMRLPEVLAGSQRVGVLQIDIDYFKQVNDSYGHATGDAVLRALGGLLLAARREGDLAVRWGGEEFLLLLPGVTADAALAIAERVRRQIEQQVFSNGRGGTFHLTCSIGFSLYPVAALAEQGQFDAVLELADLALYRAKQDGRNLSFGLVTTATLLPKVLASPFVAQLDALLAAGQLQWVREGA